MAVNFDNPNDVISAGLKIAVEEGLDQIPVVGGILGAIADALWPDASSGPAPYTPDEMFDALKDRITALINQAISANDEIQLKQLLVGFGNAIADYQAETIDILGQFDATKTTMDALLPQFQLQGLEVATLPLYTQAINALLAFLLDGYKTCLNWDYGTGAKPNAAQLKQSNILTALRNAISTAGNYVQATYHSGLTQVTASAPASGVPRFNAINDYVRETTLSVLDYAELWPFFDPVAYPNPVKHTYTRHLYGKAYGLRRTKDINLPKPPTGPIRRISYDQWMTFTPNNVVRQLRLDYDPGAGPNGTATTGVMGVPSPTSSTPQAFLSTVIDGLVVTEVRSWVGDIIDGIQFAGKWQGQDFAAPIHGTKGFNPQITHTLLNHTPTSVYIDGFYTWNGDSLPNVLVVGFNFNPS